MQKGPVVLIADDESRVRESTARILALEGFDTHAVESAEAVLGFLTQVQPEMLVVDIAMPGMSGLALCRVLRSAGSQAPILVLTARSGVQDCVEALEAGADDFLSKPFHPHELIARLRALGRRIERAADLTTPRLEFNENTRSATFEGQLIALSVTEFNLLSYLALNTGVAVSRTQISDAVWGYDLPPTSNTIDVHINALRKKLGAFSSANPIVTVRGVGYVLDFR